ncbi:PREDICTED: uncharacterized protein LOC105461951 [Wasmannia auropunctata]|uniref:uncharacterized protein LOC105461951 n=1 Tax=Wasmannia auropunctata TaxID=64793 RepID=UPI0005EE9617|nr:PREDICTED: uncharacterized protein LOC105461951 [Wasmannia auropunctata]
MKITKRTNFTATNNAIDNDVNVADRSIENRVEPVLPTYLEREQGQSGAYIRRPYTGAEKGPKEARFPHLRHAGPTATFGPHQHRQHRARHDYFRWAATAPGIGDRLNHDDHENRSRSSVCDALATQHYHTITPPIKLTAVLFHTCAR